MGDTWIVDLRHYLTPAGALAEMPRPARRLAEYFASDELLPLRVAVYAVAVAGVCGGGWLAARRAAPEKNDADAPI